MIQRQRFAEQLRTGMEATRTVVWTNRTRVQDRRRFEWRDCPGWSLRLTSSRRIIMEIVATIHTWGSRH